MRVCGRRLIESRFTIGVQRDESRPGRKLRNVSRSRLAAAAIQYTSDRASNRYSDLRASKMTARLSRCSYCFLRFFLAAGAVALCVPFPLVLIRAIASRALNGYCRTDC